MQTHNLCLTHKHPHTQRKDCSRWQSRQAVAGVSSSKQKQGGGGVVRGIGIRKAESAN